MSALSSCLCQRQLLSKEHMDYIPFCALCRIIKSARFSIESVQLTVYCTMQYSLMDVFQKQHVKPVEQVAQSQCEPPAHNASQIASEVYPTDYFAPCTALLVNTWYYTLRADC